VAGVVLAVLLLLDTIIRASYSGQVLPGTKVDGLAVGGAGEVELRRRLDRRAFASRTVIFSHEGQELRLRAGASGFRLARERTARRAMRAGRDGPLGGVGAALAGIVLGHEVTASVAVDAARLRRTVERVAGRVDREPFAGDLDVDANGHVGIVAPRPGRRLDRARFRTMLRAAVRRPGRARLALPVTQLPGPPPAAVEAVADSATGFLRRQVRVTGAGRPFVVSRAWTAKALTVTTDGEQLGLGLRPEALSALVRRIARLRDRPARDAVILASSTGAPLTEQGDVAWRPRPADVAVRPSRAGRALDVERTAASISDAVREGRHIAPAAVVATPPAVATADARRIDAQLGTFTTFFACCEPRVTNIRRIAAAVDGTVIAAGASFSLNDAAGPRTRAKGYLPAPFIADGKIVPSVGGGVSQFSTTIYNAAYFAGLQLDTHQPHSFYIDRYPAGREATLDYATIDLRWTNDTTAPVLVDTSSTPTSVTVSLYGYDEGRRVRAESGPRQPFPGGDFTITVTRVVRYGDGSVEREPFTTTYDTPPEA
jgi:vancomycin resistance protein YoaR